MELESLNWTFVIDTFLLLLIGIGPKIALVPFLEATKQMPQATQRRVLRKMLTTAATVALLLLILGGLLTRLLHFSPGALGVASGAILFIIAVTMVLGRSDSNHDNSPSAEDSDPMRIAVFPLAVPYLLNPAGIVVLVTTSAEAPVLRNQDVGSTCSVSVAAPALVTEIAIRSWFRISLHAHVRRSWRPSPLPSS
jgi:multiple antibiotic resistance protein